jgi:hypothetical protein
MSQLPPELALHLERILNIKNDGKDPLDSLSGDFDPVELLNEFFPDGMPSTVVDACRCTALFTHV